MFHDLRHLRTVGKMLVKLTPNGTEVQCYIFRPNFRHICNNFRHNYRFRGITFLFKCLGHQAVGHGVGGIIIASCNFVLHFTVNESLGPRFVMMKFVRHLSTGNTKEIYQPLGLMTVHDNNKALIKRYRG